jgi:3',5'-cyclic AMP phosphodiesterase CpdA
LLRLRAGGNIVVRPITIAPRRAGDTSLDRIRLLHFSDPHFGLGVRRVPFRDWPGKRLVGGFNLVRGRGRRFRHAPSRIASLALFAEREGADAAVCTGDLSALGTDAELEAAREAVDPFFRARLGFVCLPGNHDLYTAAVLRERRFERWFRDGLATDLPELRVDGPWPLVRLVGDTAAVVAVNSARPNPIPWRSSGRVPELQLEGLEAALAHEAVRDRFILLATHYAPRRSDGTPDTRLHGLRNADALLEVCAAARRGAILCGHIHTAFRVRPEIGPEIVCAGSATMEGHEGAWWIEIGPDRASIRPVRWTGTDWTLGEPEPVASVRRAPGPSLAAGRHAAAPR